MASEPSVLGGNPFTNAWRGFKPRFTAWLIDTWTGIMVLAGIGALHLMQRYVLSWGWIPEIIRFLDLIEEAYSAATIFVYFTHSFFSFSWGIAKEYMNHGDQA